MKGEKTVCGMLVLEKTILVLHKNPRVK